MTYYKSLLVYAWVKKYPLLCDKYTLSPPRGGYRVFQFEGVTWYDASLLHAQAKRQPVLCDKYMSAPARGGY